MTHDIGNTLLKHCGEPEIPSPAVRTILTEAICAGELTQEIESLRKQIEALEEHNANQARTIKSLELENRELRDSKAGRCFE